MDEKKFYHTDSETQIIKEYDFDKKGGSIAFTGRQVTVEGVDGFTIDRNNHILAACWGKGHIAVIDTASMDIVHYIPTPAKIPASCGFVGKDLEYLAVVTANFGTDLKVDPYVGYTFLQKYEPGGRKAFLFGFKN